MANVNQIPQFNTLPTNILYEICSFLSPSDLLTKFAVLNKRCAFLLQDPCIWKTVASKKINLESTSICGYPLCGSYDRSEYIYWKSLVLYKHHDVMTNSNLNVNKEPQRKVVCVVRIRDENLKEDHKLKYVIKNGKHFSLWPHSDFSEDEPFRFEFSRVYGPVATQEMVYRETVAFPVLNALASILANHQPTPQSHGSPQCLSFIVYGSPHSGKSHTLFGESSSAANDYGRGILPRASSDIFNFLRKYKETSSNSTPAGISGGRTTIKLGMFEIIDEEIFDLLADSKSKEPLQIYEDILQHRISIDGLSYLPMESDSQVCDKIQHGLQNRTSPELSIGCVYVHLTVSVGDSQDPNRMVSYLFVEWRGTDKDSSNNEGTPTGLYFRRPTSKITDVVFGSVLNALQKTKFGRQHIPYRASKTTRIIQDSFGGTSKTTFFFNCSAAMSNWHQTISTLRAAKKANDIQHSVPGKNLSKFY